MCLHISLLHHERVNSEEAFPGYIPRIAKKDLYCFKMVQNFNPAKGKCTSYYVNAKQKVGKVMKSRLVGYSGFKNTIDEGLHGIRIGSERRLSRIRMDRYHLTTLMLAKIPEGSKYYIGKKGDIVSNTMVLVEPIVTNEYFLDETVSDSRMTVLEMIKLANKILKGYGYGNQNY